MPMRSVGCSNQVKCPGLLAPKCFPLQTARRCPHNPFPPIHLSTPISNIGNPVDRFPAPAPKSPAEFPRPAVKAMTSRKQCLSLDKFADDEVTSHHFICSSRRKPAHISIELHLHWQGWHVVPSARHSSTEINPVPYRELESSRNPQAGKPALRSANLPVRGFERLSSRQFHRYESLQTRIVSNRPTKTLVSPIRRPLSADL